MLINYARIFEIETRKRLPAAVYNRIARKTLPRQISRYCLRPVIEAEVIRPIEKITVFASTDKGTKEDNEDSFCIYNVSQSIISRQSANESYTASVDFKNSESLMLAVADGISAVPKARESSAAVIEQLITNYPTLTLENGRFIKRAIQGINRSISRKDSGELGSTLAVVLVDRTQVHCANIGDSAIYHIHNGNIKKISVDDTVAGEMMAEGCLPHQINDSFFHALTQYVGQVKTAEPHLISFEIQYGDILIVMSDAFEPDADEVLKLIQQDGNIAEKMISSFKENRSDYYMDNSTVIIAYMN